MSGLLSVDMSHTDGLFTLHGNEVGTSTWNGTATTGNNGYWSMSPLLNIGYISNETNTDVCMYIEEFILVEIWIHCCTNWK